jgi:hypothetical protein
VTKPFRCAAGSVALAEPLAGTASTVRPFLLLEFPGPWGVDALRDGRLPAHTAAELDRRCARLGVRPLLIRRHGRSRTDGIRCFAAYAHPHRPWLESTTIHAAEEVLDLDLDRLSRGESVGLQEHPDPVFLVCTHGRHDACCAELGRPIAAALAASHPGRREPRSVRSPRRTLAALPSRARGLGATSRRLPGRTATRPPGARPIADSSSFPRTL